MGLSRKTEYVYNNGLVPIGLRVLLVLGLAILFSACSQVKFRSEKGVVGPVCEGEKCPSTCKGSECNDFTWITGDWNLCSKPCGSGEQRRSVNCRREDGVNVSDSKCAGRKPPAVRSCNVQACQGTYNWNVGSYGDCSKTCGGGTQSRTVVCQDALGNNLPDSLCSSPKPETSRSCNTQSCSGVSYSWDTGAYGACSKDCGGGTRSRTVVCRRNDGTAVADSFCSGTKPAASESCNTQACQPNFTYSWLSDNWGDCSKTCGGGTQTRSVTCKRNDGEFVTETLCPAPKPPVVQACNTQACVPAGRQVIETKTVAPSSHQVDILFVFDDSASMGADNARLAERLTGFVNQLSESNIDYNVCATSTDVSGVNGAPDGMPFVWSGTGSRILRPQTPNKYTVFVDTITKVIGYNWSDDEQGIKAMNLAIQKNASHGCFRPQASLAVILISDENERSVGGNCALSSVQCKALEALNYPTSFINTVASTFNTGGFVKPLVVNSIIVKPGDLACEAAQDAQGSPSFPGTLYKELSDRTGGYVGSICDSDYSANLRYFKDRIQNNLAAIDLQCNPLDSPALNVQISPALNTTISRVGNQVRFNPVLPEGTNVTLTYYCPN